MHKDSSLPSIAMTESDDMSVNDVRKKRKNLGSAYNTYVTQHR